MSSWAFSKIIAARYLKTKRSEAFIRLLSIISVLGVALGVIVLNVVMSVMTGFEFELKEKIIGANSHIVVRKLSGKISDWKSAVSKISQVPGVQSVSPFVYQQALIRSGNQTTGVLIRGIPDKSVAADQVAHYLEEGQSIEHLFNPPPLVERRPGESDDAVTIPALVVGKELARSLGILNGTPVSLLSASVASSPFGLVPKYRRFLVVGTYNSGLIEYESGLAYASLEATQQFFRLGDSVTGIEVRVTKVDDSPAIAQKIVEALGGMESGFYAQDWTETNKPLWDALRLEKRVYFIILLLLVVLASFSIVSTLVMIVLEKRRDIAVLRTLGASAKSIGRIFIMQGVSVGGLGTVLGLVGGYLACFGLQKWGFPIDERIFQMSTVPVKIDPMNFLVVGVSAFVICMLSTIYPVRRASRLDPSEVLRYE